MSSGRTPPPPPGGGETPSLEQPATEDDLNRLWADPPGLWGQLTGVQNDKIGARLMLTGFFFVLLGRRLLDRRRLAAARWWWWGAPAAHSNVPR